jgi:large subunit ribosomal protein L32
MAVPKKRTSKQRQRKRRTHYKAAPVATHTCPRCSSPKQPHRVCGSCGFYRNEAVLDVALD